MSEIQFVRCPECDYEQADMGRNVRCEGCGFGPMPTAPQTAAQEGKKSKKKTRRLRIRRYGIVHYHASCDQCDFAAAIQSDGHETVRDVQRAARAHVLNTAGHVVVIESGSHTRYSLEGE